MTESQMSAIKLHTDDIENFIGKMERHQLNFTSDIQREIDAINEIFEGEV